MRRLLMSVDVTYRGMDYRIREDQRINGTRMTYLSPTCPATGCASCGKVVRHGSQILAGGMEVMHPGCAIRRGLLVAVGKSESTDAAPSPVPPSGAGGA